MAFVPASIFGEDRLGRQIRRVIEAEQQIAVGRDVVESCGERALKGFDRLVEPTEVAQRVAEVAVGLGAAGVVGDGVAVGLDRLAQPALLLQRAAEVDVDRRDVRTQRQRPGVTSDRVVELPELL